MRFRTKAMLPLLLLAACGRDDTARAAPVVVDSATSIPVALERFRAGLPVLAALEQPYRDRDSLVAAVASAISRRDTVGLRALEVSRAEFAYLYYPSSPQSRPPYELPPELMWLQMEQQSARGLVRLLDRFGGGDPDAADYACESPRVEGDNTIYPACRFSSGAPIGAVIERREGFRILSYANDL
jgi:hypothetical protein